MGQAAVPAAPTVPVVSVPVHPKHDICKFHDIHTKLTKDNWMSWKRKMLAMTRDRGLYDIITGMDELPDTTN